MIIIAEVSELTRKIKLPTDRVLSVNGDYQVDGIAFKLPATYEGDFDFSTAAARVHWTGVDKVEHTNLITEVDGNGYPLWVMPSELTQGGHGVIEFAISFVATDATAAVTKRWISDPVSFRNRRTVNGSNEDEEAAEETTYDRLASAIAAVRAAQAEVEDTNAVLSSLTGSAPVPVENKSDMVDDGHLYLYTGDETGLVTGNLYYYVNGTLTNGGKYGSMEVDATLTQSGQAADAKKTGDEISQIKEDLDDANESLHAVSRSTYASPVTYTYLTNTTKWNVQAGIYPDTGGNQVSTKQCRSAFNTIKGNTLFWLESDVYTWVVWEYSSASASNATFSPHAKFSDQPVLITKEQSSTHFRVSARRKDGAAVSDSDATAIVAAVRTYMLTDTGMTVSGAAADAKAVGDLLTVQTGRLNTLDAFADNITPVVKAGNDKTTDATLWEFGTFYTAGGSRADSNNKLRLKDDITHLREVKSTSAYLFGLFAWDSSGTYIGTLQEDGTYEKASPYYADDIVLDPTNGYTYNILLKKADGTAILNVSEAANVDIVTSLPMDNKAKIAKINQDVSSLQYLVRRPFPVDGKETNALAFYTSFEALASWTEISNSEVYEFGKKSGGYVDSHIDNYTNYPLKAYFYSGRKEYLGAFSSGSNGYQIGSPYTNDSHADTSAASQYQRKKVLITAGMHGDEGATPNVLREYVRNLINNPDYADIVAAYDFCFIPLCNPYGYAIDRRNARYWDGNEIADLDMNDDFPQDSTEQITNEAKFVKSIFLSFEPDIVIDLHQHNFDTNAESVTYRLAFGGISCLQSSGIDKPKYNAMITGDAVNAERKVRLMYNIEESSQTMFCWNRDTNTTTTFREYAIGTRDSTERYKATLSAISETSTRCYLYSGSTDKYNQLANTVCQEFNDRFISGILREFAKS